MSATIDKNIARGLNVAGYWVGTFFKFTPDNSYPTGGYSLAAGDIKMGSIEYMAPFIVHKTTDGSAAVIAQYRYATGKVQLYWVAGAAGQAAKLLVKGGQAPGIALQMDVDSAAGVLGKTTATDFSITTTISAAAGSLLQEVDNGTDLSAYQGRALAFGKG